MSEPTIGDLARFLADNPGPHRVGNSIVEHVATFTMDDWNGASDE